MSRIENFNPNVHSTNPRYVQQPLPQDQTQGQVQHNQRQTERDRPHISHLGNNQGDRGYNQQESVAGEPRPGRTGEVNRYISSGREIICYNCRQLGHISRFCPHPRMNDSQQNTRFISMQRETPINRGNGGGGQ